MYVAYQINGEIRTNYFTNDGGCGTTWGHNIRTGPFSIKYKVCVNDSVLLPDTCSGWKSDRN